MKQEKFLESTIQKDGLVKVTIGSRNCIGYLGFFSNIELYEKKPDLIGSCVYLLIGKPEDDSVDYRLYIGQTSNFFKRSNEHLKKSQWTKFLFFISADIENSSAMYLEKELVDFAKKSNISVELQNQKGPQKVTLKNSSKASAKAILEDIIQIIQGTAFCNFPEKSTMGSNLTDLSKKKSVSEFYIKIKTNKKDVQLVNQIMHIGKDEWLLKAGSHIKSEYQKNLEGHSYYSIWRDTIKSKRVRKSKIQGMFITNVDIVFKSPSALAAVVLGSCVNGKKLIRFSKNKKTIKEINYKY